MSWTWKIVESQHLSRSTDVFEMSMGLEPTLLVYSELALRQLARGVRWHDDADHCPTWGGSRWGIDCRCDVGDE